MTEQDGVVRWIIRGTKVLRILNGAITAYELVRGGKSVYDVLTAPNPFGVAGPRPRVIYDESRRRNWLLQADGSYRMQDGPQQL